MRPPSRCLAPSLFAVLAACATAPPAPAVHRHTHTATLTVADTGLRPGPHVAIPTYATVVWRNDTATPIAIEVAAATCNDCDTVLGFAAGDGGASATEVAPGAVATLCFHDAGSFAFVVRGAGTEHRGTIDVGGRR
ncbi:MAG: hypothetical protein JNM25_07610 [Planctomycetes bacterium]|nr:hypothetical protein [Planctomycetota bacterium]